MEEFDADLLDDCPGHVVKGAGHHRHCHLCGPRSVCVPMHLTLGPVCRGKHSWQSRHQLSASVVAEAGDVGGGRDGHDDDEAEGDGDPAASVHQV